MTSDPSSAAPSDRPPDDVAALLRERDVLAEQLRAAFLQSPVSTIVYDAAGRPLAVNPAFERLWGARLADLPPGYSVLDDPQLEVAGVLPLLRRAFGLDGAATPEGAGEPVSLPPLRYDVAVTTGHGRITWTQAHAYPVRDASGAVARVVLSHEDVTARREAEEALARQSALTRLVAGNATSALFMMDRDGHPTYMNPAAEAMTGWTLDEIRGMPLHYAIHHTRPDGSAYPMAECPIDRALPENSDVRAHPDVFVRKDGSFFPVLCAASPIVENGVPVGTVVEVRDVTAERAAEAAMRELTRELEARNADLQEQGLELELTNQQLLDQAAELEAQTVELQATAAELEERTLEAEAERARAGAILDGMADAHFALDAEFRFVTVNRAMERSSAIPRERLLGRTLWEAIPGIVGTDLERHCRQVATERAEAHFTHAYGGAGAGPTRMLEVDAYPAPGGGLAVFWRDVTARLQAAAERERLLAEAERARAEAEAARQRMLDTFEAISDPFFTVDRDWILTYINPPTERVVGRPREQLIGRHLWEEFSEAVGTPFYEGAHRALREGRAVDVEAHYPPPLDFWAAMRMYPLADGLAVYYQDVTARKRAEAGLRASEQRLRDLFEQAPVAVAVLTGPALVYTVMSPRYAAFIRGGTANLGKPFREAVPEIAGQGVAELMEQVYRTGEPYFAHERLVRLDRDGDSVEEEYYFDIGYQPLRDAAGEVYAIASTSLDVTAHVTARREAEAARLEAERQREAAEAANRAKSEFLSTMSHELRTPLNAIQGYTELLTLGLRGPVTEAQQHDLERVRRANQHLMGLITDILNFARLEAGQVEFHVADVDLAPVIADLETLVGPQLAAKGLTFEHDACAPDTPEQPHVVRADPEKLRQVLLNLLTNAVKFTDRGGHVAIACETDRGAGVVRVRVSDTGRGIPRDQLERIFEPFVQVDRHRTHASQQGVGLGLAISRDLARGMGGDLAAESEEGRGSTFTVTLRLVEPTTGVPADRRSDEERRREEERRRRLAERRGTGA
jgi:PAS domain S-box-containing protein